MRPFAQASLLPRGLLAGTAAALLAVLLGLTWAVASAPGSSPDDDFHLATIWCAWAPEKSGCTILDAPPAPAQKTVSVPALAIQTACAAFHPETSGLCPYLLPDGTAVYPAPAVYPLRADNGSYPPGFYAFMRLFVGSNAAGSIVAIRMVSATISVVLLALAGLVSPRPDRWRWWLYLLVSAVPLGLFVFASTNPSGLALAGVTAIYPATLGVLAALREGRRWWPAAALATVAALIAVGSRTDAVYFCAVAVAAAVAVSFHLHPRRWLPQLSVLAPVGLALLLGLVWRDAGGLATAEPITGGEAPTGSNAVNILSMYVGEFATRLGWLDTSMPSLVWGAIALALGAILAYGMGGLGARRFLAAGFVLAVMVALPMLMLEQWNAAVGAYVQPRYVLPLVGILMGVLALLDTDLGPRPNRRQLAWLAALAVVAHSVALHVLMRRFVTGTDVRAVNLDAGREWWWDVSVTPMVIWVSGSLVFTALAVLLAVRAGSLSEPAGQPVGRGTSASSALAEVQVPASDPLAPTPLEDFTVPAQPVATGAGRASAERGQANAPDEPTVTLVLPQRDRG